MKIVLVRAVLALVLGLTAWLCWREARIVDHRADARMRLSLLQFDVDEPPVPDWTLSDVVTDARPLAADARRDTTTAAYWQGRFADVMDIGRQELDPDLLWLAANASFRASQREGMTSQAAVQRLDGVLQAYAAVLRATPAHADAAFNYELMARLRDATASAAATRTKADIAPPPRATAPASDLPNGPTLHGVPGAPPPEVKAEEFQIIAPMEFGDREAQPEPTPGAKLPRKG